MHGGLICGELSKKEMKAKTRCILFEGITLAVSIPVILALAFDAPRAFLWACMSLLVIAITVVILFKVKRWGWYRNSPSNTIDEKTSDNISALGILAFVVVFGLAIFMPQFWKDADAPTETAETEESELRNSIEN